MVHISTNNNLSSDLFNMGTPNTTEDVPPRRAITQCQFRVMEFIHVPEIRNSWHSPGSEFYQFLKLDTPDATTTEVDVTKRPRQRLVAVEFAVATQIILVIVCSVA